METRIFQTPLGEIWLQGQAEAFDGERPLIVGITGATAEPEALDRLGDGLPQAAALVGHLPGNHCPPLLSASVGAYAAAYSAALAQLGRPTIICGASVGGLVGMGVRAPNLRGLVALDPPLRTLGLWRTLPRFQAFVRTRATAEERAFFWNVFGVAVDRIEDRDYRPLLDGLSTPTWCIVGGVPLMPERPLEQDPSLVGEAERALLRAHPAIRVAVAEGVGHNIPGHAPGLVVAALRHLLETQVSAP